MAIVGEPGEETQKCRVLVTTPICVHTNTRVPKGRHVFTR